MARFRGIFQTLFINLWAWVMAVVLGQPAYISAEGKHIIRNKEPGCIYITLIPTSNPLYTNNPPIRNRRYWVGDRGVSRFIGTEFVHCPEDRSDWRIRGRRATRGCYIEGAGFDGYIVEEIGLYTDSRAEIRPGPDSMYQGIFLTAGMVNQGPRTTSHYCARPRWYSALCRVPPRNFCRTTRKGDETY